ncbi:SAM-dependent methyltransferase [Bradyrhizobium genosp. SA-3]|uniref:class I SAM-dependent methyltransferase n=1 Tax=Bradyrhizobium genosp. SA-3 TaxID=508868 RepID=UPI0010291701|nr:class I SAM-dependent methyltransferase [Bradyrhizobium genosp. SA-3]RZN10783.1 SAM-dependent methyltransferase [Bradyrhizobium genosp. SA-3]
MSGLGDHLFVRIGIRQTCIGSRYGHSGGRTASGGPATTLVRTVTLVVALAITPVCAVDIGFLAVPGIPAKEFPSPRRPVAAIASLSRSAHEHRDLLNEAGEVAGLLELRPGMTVGDLGAGSGYYTVHVSRLVGSKGFIIAQGVRRDYLIELGRRTEELKLTNVIFALGEPHDPRLPASSLDAAILGHMYHEIAQPYAFLYNLVPALKPGARIGVVDFERPTSKHGTPIELLRCELSAVGYGKIATYQLAGDGGYLAVFVPPQEASRKSPRDIVACTDRTGSR